MSNAYAEVIDLLNGGNIDYRRIAIELAKTSPTLFLKLHNGEKPKLLHPIVLNEIRSFMKNGQMISAIKSLRTATITTDSPHGLGLKEARDIIFVASGKEHLNLDKVYLVYVNEIQS